MNNSINSGKYEEIIKSIKTQVDTYNNYLSGNIFYLGLANGDNLKIRISKNHIAHLLGVQTDKLKISNIVPSSSLSYDILQNLINYNITFYDMKKNYNFDGNNLFSDYIDNKIEAFQRNIKIRSDDIYCVIKYCSNRTYTIDVETNNSDYFIVRKVNNQYMVLGIVKDNDSRCYIPVTSRLYKDQEEFDNFMNTVAVNQEITYVSTFTADNYENDFHSKFNTTLEDKLKLNKSLKSIADKYSAIPSTYRDTTFTIERLLNNRQKDINNTSILKIINDNLKSGNLIDKEDIKQMLDDSEIPEELEVLIDICNDSICYNNLGVDEVSNSYSTIQNENILLKEELERLKLELINCQNEKVRLENEVNSLSEENNNNSEKLKVLTNAFQSIMN